MYMTELDDLVPGTMYEFHTKTWLSPFAETIPAARKIRKFIRIVYIETQEIGPVPFVELGKSNGTRDLIAVEIIIDVVPLTSH